MSINIPVEITGFPPASPWASNGTLQHGFSWNEIMRAAVVAGYWCEESIPSRQYRQWRGAALNMAVRQAHGTLVRPPEWHLFDTTERGLVATLLGVIMTKLLVEKVLGAPYLLFLDVHFELQRAPGTPAIRPDFIALRPDHSHWNYFSVEAKGRTRLTKKGLAKGKDQASSIGTIDGHKVDAHVVCLTSLPRGELHARFHDPIPGRRKLHNVITRPMEAVSNYYQSFYKLAEVCEPMGPTAIPGLALEAELWAIPELGLQVGLHPYVQLALGRTQGILEAEPREFETTMREVARQAVQSEGRVGPDGIIVIPGKRHSQDW